MQCPPHGSILVYAKEVSDTMLNYENQVEMQRLWDAEDRKIVDGVKTLIQFFFHP